VGLSTTGFTRRTLLASTAALAIAWDPAPARAKEVKRMKLGTITYNVAQSWDLSTLLHHVKAAGMEGVELRTGHAHGVEVTLTSAQRKETRRRFADSGVTLWGLGTVCEFHATDAAVVARNIEDCKRWCELAQDVGAHGVKVRPNGLPEGVPIEKTLAQIGAALAECGRAADANGVEIWLEVHGQGTAHPPYIRAILDHAAHPRVGACWNSNKGDIVNGSVKQYFDLLAPLIRSCHVNDLWDEAYPYRELFALLQRSGYDRFTLCEVGASIRPEDGVPFLSCYHGLWRALCGPLVHPS
jgi:sugar phosphate isomerase/epimerase